MDEVLDMQQSAPMTLPVLKVKTKIHWWVILLATAISAGIFYWFGLRGRLTPATVTLPDYITSHVSIQDFTVSVSGSATVQSAEAVTLTTLVKGEVLEAPFEEGQTVQEGDLLYRIDSSDLQTTIHKSELSVEKMRNSYNDILKNIETTKTDRAKAADELTLTVSESGLVTEVYVEAGDTINAGQSVAEIVDRENLLLKVPFHSVAATGFSVGQSAQVTVDSAGVTLAGTITKIGVLDEAGPGGTLVRYVTIQVKNPGTLTETATGTAVVDRAASAASGSFSYRARTTLTAKKGGTIDTLYITEGAWVTEGQAALTLDAEEALASYDKQLETLQNNVRDAEVNLRDAELSLQNTREQLDSYTIYSTVSGRVIVKQIAQGDNVEGTSTGTLAVIYNMDSLEFELSIDELDIGQIAVGQTVLITAEALSGKAFTGRVSRINYQGRTNGGVTVYPVTVTIDEAGSLLPGMNISAEILVEEASDVLCVPINAVRRGGIVLTPGEGAIGADGSIDETKLVETPVTTGRTNGAFIEITNGLSEGDTILIKNESTGSGGMFQMGGNEFRMGGMGGTMPAGSTFTVVEGSSRAVTSGGGEMTIRMAP